MSIYEGTSGIQALDLLLRRVLRDDGARYRLMTGAMRADIARGWGMPGRTRLAAAVEAGVDRLDDCTTFLQQRLAESPRQVEWAATDYLQLTGIVAGAWMWLRMAMAGASRAGHAERDQLAGFYMEYLLPQGALHETRIRHGGRSGA
jgi:hypothetical protein